MARTQVIGLVKELLRERGEMTIDEIATELMERQLAYTTVKGESFPISSVALDRILTSSPSFNHTRAGGWELDESSDGRKLAWD